MKNSFEIKEKYGWRKNMVFRSDQRYFLFWPDFSEVFLGLNYYLGVILLKPNHKSKIYISDDSLFSDKNFDTKNVEIHRKFNYLDIFLLKYPQKLVSLRGVFRVLRSLIMKNFKKNFIHYNIFTKPLLMSPQPQS